MRVVTGLSCQSVNDRGDINFTRCIHLLVDVRRNILASLLKKLNVGRVAELCDYLQSWIQLFYRFVDEDVFGI